MLVFLLPALVLPFLFYLLGLAAHWFSEFRFESNLDVSRGKIDTRGGETDSPALHSFVGVISQNIIYAILFRIYSSIIYC
jgi:hypothetical protein